jgi:NTE family protein
MRKAKLRYWLDPALPRTGLVGGHKIEQMLRATIDDIDFSALRLPFACVATDIESGEEVVINRGIVWKAVRASFTIPGIFTVVKIDDRYLVDGGLVNPVPVRVLPAMGADFVIAVNVIPNISAQDSPRWFPGDREKIKRKEPTIISILMQSVYIGTHAIAQNCLREADIAIEPQVAHIGPADFQMVDECIKQGQIAAEKALPVIKEKLAQKSVKSRL